MMLVFKYLDLRLLELLVDKGMTTKEICNQMGIERRIAYKGFRVIGKWPEFPETEVDEDNIIKQRIYEDIRLRDIRGTGQKKVKPILRKAGVKVFHSGRFKRAKSKWKEEHGELPQALKDIPRTEFKKILKEHGGMRGVSKYLDFTELEIRGAVLYHGLKEV